MGRCKARETWNAGLAKAPSRHHRCPGNRSAARLQYPQPHDRDWAIGSASGREARAATSIAKQRNWNGATRRHSSSTFAIIATVRHSQCCIRGSLRSCAASRASGAPSHTQSRTSCRPRSWWRAARPRLLTATGQSCLGCSAYFPSRSTGPTAGSSATPTPHASRRASLLAHPKISRANQN